MQPGTNADLLRATLEVVNVALERHRDHVPYAPLLALGASLIAGQRIEVAVYESDPDEPLERFSLRFLGGQFELTPGRVALELSHLRVSRKYLRHVAAHAFEYIEQPVQLDRDWLRSRLGLEI